MNHPPAKIHHPEMPHLRVLICEDEGLRRLRLRKVLRELGYEVIGEAANGEDAVQLARDLRPDLILMDVNMPRLSGIEATRSIMLQAPTAIVMITAYSDPDQVSSALKAGASGYLVKPVRDEQLQPAISVALAGFAQVRASNTELQCRVDHLMDTGSRERLLLDEAERQARDAKQEAWGLLRDLERQRESTLILAKSYLGLAPEVAGLEIATRYEPATEPGLVGGDFVDFIPLGEQRLGLVIGDLCGHGLAVAPHLARAKFMLRAYALEDPAPAQVVTRVNRALLMQLEEACPFLTLCYGVLDLRSWVFTYCCAGHPEPVLGPTEAGALETLEVTGGLVGALKELQFGEQSVSIPPGAALVLFTDGVTEARAGGELFKHEGVFRTLREHPTSEADEIADALLSAARTFADGELTDDVAIIVARRPR